MWKIEQRDGDFVMVVQPVALEVDEEHRVLLQMLAELNGRSIEEELREHLRRYPEREEDEDDGPEPGELWDLAEVSEGWTIMELLEQHLLPGWTVEDVDTIEDAEAMLAEAHTGEWGSYPADPAKWDEASAELIAAVRAGSLPLCQQAAARLTAIDLKDSPAAV